MTEKKYPSDKQDKFMLRLPEGMRERIRIAAESSGRSMNAEVVARLTASFEFDQEAGKVSEMSGVLDQKLAEIREGVALMERSKADAQKLIDEIKGLDNARAGDS